MLIMIFSCFIIDFVWRSFVWKSVYSSDIFLMNILFKPFGIPSIFMNTESFWSMAAIKNVYGIISSKAHLNQWKNMFRHTLMSFYGSSFKSSVCVYVWYIMFCTCHIHDHSFQSDFVWIQNYQLGVHALE